MFFAAENISKNFEGLKVLDHVSLEVGEKEILALIGPNGAGKTTFFNILSGIYTPTEGKIRFKGKSIAGLASYQIAERGIARTFQNLRLFPQMTVLENILSGFFFKTRYGLADALFKTKRFKQEEEKDVREACEISGFIGLKNKENELARNLSYGEQKKLEIARALALDPSLLLLDEPTAGMNHKETENMIDLIRKIREGGIAVILIEHDMKVVMNISDRIIVLDYGETIAEGRPEEIRNNEKVIEAYLGKRT
ncbi:MAG: ABC transporter ATP-binding protein [Candidatus Omnitrophota bacterium]|nr:ABC transporter ATP-binding protein [Candidatus Omnitrophota bacterium]